MPAALKTGDDVTASSLEEVGTRPRPLKGTLTVQRVPANDPYPAFTVYFVDGQEANIATVKKLTLKAELALSEAFSNDCHDQQGRFCESAGSTTPEGSAGGKYWLSAEGTFHPVQVTHAEISGSNIAQFAKDTKALRVSGLSPTDVNIEMWHPATPQQVDAIATHLTRWHTYVEAHSGQKDTYESLDDAKPHEVAALLGRMNDFFKAPQPAPSRLKEYLKAETDEYANDCHDETGRFCETGGTSAASPKEVSVPKGLEGAALIDHIQQAMGMTQTTDEKTNPERYEPNKGFGVHLKLGQSETRIERDKDNNPVLVDYTSIPMKDAVQETQKTGKNFKELGIEGSAGSVALKRDPSTERPLPYVFRIVSEEDYQHTLKQGYYQSDGRMNLEQSEGTVTSSHELGTFYAAPGENRFLRFKVTPQEGWKVDPRDEYVKTQKQIPLSTIDLVSPPFNYDKKSGNTSLLASAAASPAAAGLAVVAQDTGRVLMLQRALSPNDPAAGKWEFPGGTLDQGETPDEAAAREWSEETGATLPTGRFEGSWTSPDGVYQGFVYHIPRESDLPINLDHEDRQILNPDDPDGDQIETVAWWNPEDLRNNPALRDEAQTTDWDVLRTPGSRSSSTLALDLTLFNRLFEFYNANHDEQGRFAESNMSKFPPGSTEATIGMLLDSFIKPNRYGEPPKTIEEAKGFINGLREKSLQSEAGKKYVEAIDKALPVWVKQTEKAQAPEKAYHEAVNNPKVPDQLFNPRYAAEVKARQTELAENQIISKDYVAAHPQYTLAPSQSEGSEFGWLHDAKTGEPLTQSKVASLAKAWTNENEAVAEKLVKNSDVYVRLEPSSLTGLLRDGRLSTFHEEAGQENSISNHEGGATPEQRRSMEEAYFGKGTYPVYGYLSDDHHGFLDLANSHPLASVEGSLGFYGDIAVKLRPEVKDRTTYTLGDSAALYGGQPVVSPQPVNHPSSLAGAHYADLHGVSTIREATLRNFGKVSYFESQIHGGVKLSDIADIKFTYKPPPEVQALLKSQGVKWDSLSKADNEGYSAEEYGITASALPTDYSQLLNPLDLFNNLLEFANPNHDEKGRFTEGGGAGAAPTPTLPSLSPDQYKLLQPAPFNRMLKADTESQIMQTPNGAAFVQAIDDWASAEKTTALRSNITKEINNPGSGNDKARAVLGALRGAATDNQPLYRGMAVSLSHNALAQKYKEGSTIDMNLSSFSTNHEVANGFAQPTSDAKETKVMLALTGVHKAVPIQNLTSTRTAYKELEHVTGGRFTVTSISQQQLGGEGPEGKFTVIQLHQVNTL